MSAPKNGPSDEAVEQFIGRVLQIGVLLAAAVTLAGGVVVLARHGGTVSGFASFKGEAAYLTSVEGVLGAVRRGHADALVQFGILLLIAVPIVRVAFTLVAFALQRDRAYVLITAIVLTLLMYGLFFGGA
ncbi:MAG: DUF1634 domain-containing protein [Gemmatimonadaceae bacterium]